MYLPVPPNRLSQLNVPDSGKRLPRLPETDFEPRTGAVETVAVDALIIGGGPAGLSAAIELGKRGVETLLVDDKHRLGGKLVLHTAPFAPRPKGATGSTKT